MLLWYINVNGNNADYTYQLFKRIVFLLIFHSLQMFNIKAAMKHNSVPFAHGLLYTKSLAKQIAMIYKSLRSFSHFVNDTVKHLTRIRQNQSNTKQ